MEVKPVRTRAKEIQDRFFQALDLLIDTKKIDSLQSFCECYDLHRPKYSTLRSKFNDNIQRESGYKFIDIDSISYLVSDYKVSAEWLLLGKGKIFKH